MALNDGIGMAFFGDIIEPEIRDGKYGYLIIFKIVIVFFHIKKKICSILFDI